MVKKPWQFICFRPAWARLGLGLCFLAFFSLLNLSSARASGRLYRISDYLKPPWPLSGANHTIRFRVDTTIPPLGKIKIIPQAGAFVIPSDFDYRAVDLATSSDRDSGYIDRQLGSALAAGVDRVSVATGTEGSITITLNPVAGIAAGSYVKIELGTNASYQASSSAQIINPLAVHSYYIYVNTFNSADELLDYGELMVALSQPVGVGNHINKIRANGRPEGTLSYGTTQTILSLTTNYQATCRYSTTPNTAYDDMENEFANTGEIFHSDIITGLESGHTYHYYVRCLDQDNIADTDDYEITFDIATPNTGEGGEGGGEGGGQGGDSGQNEGEGTSGDSDNTSSAGAGGGGGIGGGGGGGFGQDYGPQNEGDAPYPPDLPGPSITLAGWAYPDSKVNILRDGVFDQEATADSQAHFSLDITDLSEGIYTFTLWALDSAGRKSNTQSSTFWVEKNTRTTANFFLPPTIAVSTSSVAKGEKINFFGQTVPQAKVVILIRSSDGKQVAQTETTAGQSGDFQLAFDTASLPANGVYTVQARTYLESAGFSEYNSGVQFGLGVEPGGELTTCQRADLNHDGRINLTDFSILLYHWGTDHVEADINLDGKVNLIDFSLLMYCWTG